MSEANIPNGDERGALVVSLLGFLTTTVTGAACAGPVIAIALGVGGLGWLTQYAYLRVPATVATAAFLAAGFYFVYLRRPRCARRRPSRLATGTLWAATALAVAVNVFEYLVFPWLG